MTVIQKPQAAEPVLRPGSAIDPGAPPAPVRSRRRLLPWFIAGILLAGGGIYAWKRSHESAEATAAARAAPAGYRLSTNEIATLRIDPATVAEFRSERVAEGRIAFNADRATPVFAPYTGRVTRLVARLGQTVRAGETLFEMETSDVAAAANDLLAGLDNVGKARTTLDLAQRQAARQRNLLEARAVSRRDLEQALADAANAASDLRVAETALDAARNRLRVLGRSAEQLAEIERTRQVQATVAVTAPIAGTVTGRRVGPGQWVSAGAGDAAFTINDLTSMWLVAAVREADSPAIRVGQPVVVKVGALPGREFRARIASVDAGIDPATRRLTVRAEVEDPDALLKPEMFADFRIELGAPQQSPSVPMRAVILRGDEASVWTVQEGNRLELRRIQTGIRSGDSVQVISGLAAGERVVTAGALFVDRAARTD